MHTVKQVAESLNLSTAVIYRYVAVGELECHRFGNAIRVSEAQLEEFLERKRVESESKRFSAGQFKHL